MSYRASSASYASAVDMLYIIIDPSGCLSACHSIEDTPSGITVMYASDGSVIGAEVPDFLERYDLPATIEVDSSNPFEIMVDSARGLVED